METQAVSMAASMQVLRMTDGLIAHHSVCAAARLGIADFLKDGERSTSELSASLHLNEDALYRVLRFLTGQGVFRETSPRKFVNNSLSECLRIDVPETIRSILLFRGSPSYLFSFAGLHQSLETGKPALDKLTGMDTFESMRRNPGEARIFDEAMTAISALWAPSIANAYDFGRWGSLMDVGGGNGLLLAEILRTYPGLSGVLADQMHVLERAGESGFLSGELSGRLQLEPCDFFQAIPSGCRAYLMKNVIHDWDDQHAHRILVNCRRAAPKDGVLLLVEYHLGETNSPSLGKAVDVIMLTVTGGKERTFHEHRELLASADFHLNRVIPVSNDVMIVEALPM